MINAPLVSYVFFSWAAKKQTDVSCSRTDWVSVNVACHCWAVLDSIATGWAVYSLTFSTHIMVWQCWCYWLLPWPQTRSFMLVPSILRLIFTSSVRRLITTRIVTNSWYQQVWTTRGTRWQTWTGWTIWINLNEDQIRRDEDFLSVLNSLAT